MDELGELKKKEVYNPTKGMVYLTLNGKMDEASMNQKTEHFSGLYSLADTDSKITVALETSLHHNTSLTSR